jgi:uncharacterized membrane protein YhaH (DUF805 family)
VAEAREAYYLDGARNQQGPVPADEIARLIRSGTIRRDTMIWYAGMPEWRPAGQVSDFASLFAQSAPPPPSSSAVPPMQRSGPAAGAHPGQVPYAPAGQYDPGARMGFGGAIATCFRKYVDFTGRARRSEFWFFYLFYTLVVIVLLIIDITIFGVESGMLPFRWLASLVFFLPWLAVAVRRLHDRDRSGWMLLIYLIPLVGPVLVIIWWCMRGTPGPNRFGPDPLGSDLAAAFD